MIGDAQDCWVRTRRIWNQHAYHVTNINDDGSVPRDEALNGKQPGLNNFRQNVQTKNIFSAPDLIPRDVRVSYDLCPQNKLVFAATVFNRGAATAMPGVPVSFYQVDNAGASKLLRTVRTTSAILAGGSQVVSQTWVPMSGSAAGPFQVRVVVDDDGKGASTLNECDEANNQSAPITVGCPTLG